MAPRLVSSPGTGPALYELAFVRDASIWLTRLDGNSLRLTHGSSDHSPRWAADGSRLVFVRGVGRLAELYIVGADGSGLHRLTNDALEQSDPRWSPRGDRIAYVQPRDTNGNGAADETEDTEIWLMPSGGGRGEKLVDGFDPAWAPDGSQIAYASNGTRSDSSPAGPTRNSIEVVDLQSRSRRAVLPMSAVPQNFEQTHGFPFHPDTNSLRTPTWSADGRRLALSTFGHTGFGLSVDLAGADPKVWELSYHGSVLRTAFAPRGSLLAIETAPASGYDYLLLVETAGGQKSRIGRPELDLGVGEPTWAPDGQRLAAVAYPGVDRIGARPRELIVFDPRGRPLAQVAAGDLGQPAWNPTR